MVFANITKGRLGSVVSVHNKDFLIFHLHNCFIQYPITGMYKSCQYRALYPNYQARCRRPVSQTDSESPPKSQTQSRTYALGVHKQLPK